MSLFLVWYDPDARRSIVEKIQDALAAYGRRFSATPNLVLISASDVAELAGVEVRSTRTVQPHHFWVGLTDERNAEVTAEEAGKAHG
jgi:hypothetical protein